MVRSLCPALVLVAVMVIGNAAAQQRPKYDDPSRVDEDYAVQGEYVGMIETDDGPVRVGAQVIALGGGKFRAVGYPGGLPGAGWNGEDRILVEGERQEDGTVVFRREESNTVAVIRDGKLSIQQEDRVLATLEKIERRSPTLGQKPPENAVVLFDGTSTDAWINGRMTPDGLLMEGTTSKERFGSHKVHLEFRTPYQPYDRGQARGNSGVYLQGRYEVQILDSFGSEGKHNECGGLYSVKDPDINMCLPPLVWQTYDIEFIAARYDENGKLVANPRITVYHNGVLVHNNVELPGDRSTTAAPVPPSPEKGPLYLQDHGCPVRFRNIWVVPLDP